MPDLLAFAAGDNGSALRNEVLCPVILFSVHPIPEIHRIVRCVQQKWIGIQFALIDLDHGPRLPQSGSQVLGIPALQNKLLIRDCRLVSEQCRLLLFSHVVESGFAILGNYRVGPGAFHAFLCEFEVLLRLAQLGVGELLKRRLGPRLRLLPAGTVIDDVVRGRRIPHIASAVLSKGISLSDVGIILRLSRRGIVVLFRRDVTLLGSDLLAKPNSAPPDGSQLIMTERWIAGLRFLHKQALGLVRAAVPLNQSPGYLRHGSVALPLWDLVSRRR